ncbi:MAG TPA: AAA family ATPase [Gaiellaceae bacterium]|nr:AAA family ATPase [Gaiellaceae bacterium]
MRSVATSLVGRDEELESIEAFLARATEASSALVLAGEPGIGKTSLWRHGLDAAEDAGVRTLAARPNEAEAAFAYAALTDVLATVREETAPLLPEPQRRALEIALLLEEPDAATERHGVALAFLGVLRMLAEDAPVLVAVDDVQWLDRASADVLAYAARRVDDEPVGFLLARRVERDGAPSGLERAFRAERLETRTLRPLSLGAVHRLLHERLGRAFARPVLRRIHELSGGNPFYALELAEALEREAGRLDRDGPLPLTLEALVRERLVGLPRATRRVLAAAAAGAQPTVALLERAGESDALASLAPAVEADVVAVENGRVRFTHPLLASGAYALAGVAERRDLHRILAGLADDPEERARHRALAAPGPDPEVADALDAAASQARRRGAPVVAAELGERAVALTPPGRVHDRQRRLVETALFHFESGDSSRARSMLEQIAGELPFGGERARTLVALARVRSYDDDLRAATALFEQALAEAEDAQVRAAAHEGVSACLFRRRERHADGIDHGQAAFELARELGNRPLLVEALGSRMLHEAILGRPAAARTLEQALALRGEGTGERVLRDPRFAAGVLRLWWDELERAHAEFEELAAAARATGDEASLPYVLFMLAQTECRLGAFDEAAARAEEANELTVQSGQEWLEAYAHALRALADAYRGREDGARAAAARALALAGATGSAPAEQFALTALGHLELSLGRPGDAWSHLEPVVVWAEREGADEPGAVPCLPDAVEALVEAGRLDEAEEALGRLEVNARRLGRASAEAACARLEALLAAARGEREAAAAAFERALAAHEHVPMPLERARTLIARGAFLRRGKRKREARESLEQAVALCEEVGAAVWAERARSELGRIGGRAPSRGELTPAERRVAELVAEGRTNREVAAALFLSDRTVEGHLSRVYMKLGVRSRAELARRFAST